MAVVVVTVADHDAVAVGRPGVAARRWRSVSSGVGRVNLQDLTHLSATGQVIFDVLL